MMKRIQPGEKFGRLTVVGDDGTRSKHMTRLLLCRCECGNEKHISSVLLRDKRTRSCGCLQKESRLEVNKTHGESIDGKISSEYVAWCAMKSRCGYKKNNRFQFYGARGIKVCERWKNNYQKFLSDMGRKPSPKHSLDRIDVNGNYEPGNCRWATTVEQRSNRRDSAKAA